jgi:hypothetical protein
MMIKVTENCISGEYVLDNRIQVTLIQGPTDCAIRVSDIHTGNSSVFAIDSDKWKRVPCGLPNLVEVTKDTYNWLLNQANKCIDEVNGE